MEPPECKHWTIDTVSGLSIHHQGRPEDHLEGVHTHSRDPLTPQYTSESHTSLSREPTVDAWVHPGINDVDRHIIYMSGGISNVGYSEWILDFVELYCGVWHHFIRKV